MKIKDRIDAALNRKKAIALLKGAIAHNSITGNEANFVGFLNEQMQKRRLAPETEEFLSGRPNIWGTRTGRRDGKRLRFIGHTDTVHVDGWSEHWQGTERENPFGGVEVDGAIWGRGFTDPKCGIILGFYLLPPSL